MRKNNKLFQYLGLTAELLTLVIVIAAFCYSGFKIAEHFGFLNKKVFGAEEQCGSCPSCLADGWRGDICRGIKYLCEHQCSCDPTTTPQPNPTPTPTEAEPTPTPENPTPTVSEPSPTPTFVSLPTATPKLEEGGIGGPSDDGGSGGPVGAPVCTDAVPSKPFLREAKTLGGGKVSLLWDLVEPTTHYTIAYGPTSGNYLYGVDNTGKASSFIIGGLGSGNYCFAVRGVNNCMPGEFSNELCTGQTNKVLGASVLGATGSFNDNLLQIAFIMGTICSSIGISLLSGNKNSA